MQGYKQVSVYGISFDVSSKQPIVLLKVKGENRFLPIWIGPPEAAAIIIRFQKAELSRPMTHDLLASVINELSAELVEVLLTELRNDTFYASIKLKVLDGQEIILDSRPSDAIALALRTDTPIFAADEIVETNTIEFDHEIEDMENTLKEFREFLDEVSPEDFSKA